MTPKEKAFELVSNLCEKDCTLKNINKNKKISKLICENIIDGYNDYLNYLNVELSISNKLYLYYWQEVKNEINKL